MSDPTRGGKRRTRRTDPAAAMLAAMTPEDVQQWMTAPHPDPVPQRGKRRDPVPGQLEIVCSCSGVTRRIAVLTPLTTPDGGVLSGWSAATSHSRTGEPTTRLYCQKCRADVRLSAKNGEVLTRWVVELSATRLELRALARLLRS